MSHGSMRRTRRRSLIIVVAVIAAVVVVTGAAGGYVLLTRTQGSPQQTAASYLRDWQRGSYAAMDKVSVNVPGGGLATPLRQTAAELGQRSIHLQLGRITVNGGSARARFTASADLASGHTWTYPGQLQLVTRNRHWWVNWTPSAIYPGLRAGERFVLSAIWPARAAVLAADGTALSSPAVIAQSGSIALLTGTVVAATKAQAKALGAPYEAGDLIGQGGVEPGPPFPETAPRLPQWLQRGRQRQRQLDVGVFAAPGESGAQVVDLGVGLLESLLIITACRRVEQRRDRRVVVAVTRPDGIGLAGFAELFQRVLAHGFQQPVAGSASAVVGHHQRLVHQQGQLIEHLIALHLTATGDRLGRGQVEPTQKHRQPAKQHPLRLGQQRMRPIHRGAQGLLATHRGARTPGQQPEPVTQTIEYLGRRQSPHPCCRQLDRQRHAIQAAADLDHDRGIVIGNGEAGLGQAGAVGEQLDGCIGH